MFLKKFFEIFIKLFTREDSHQTCKKSLTLAFKTLWVGFFFFCVCVRTCAFVFVLL